MQTLEYYLTGKSSEVLIHATVVMNVENIMLSENSYFSKTIQCMII